MIRLNGHIDVPADKMAEAAPALAVHIRLSLAEAGCLSFSVTPDAEVAGRFHVAESFVDRAAFDAHQARGADSDWGRLSQGWPRSYSLDESTQ